MAGRRAQPLHKAGEGPCLHACAPCTRGRRLHVRGPQVKPPLKTAGSFMLCCAPGWGVAELGAGRGAASAVADPGRGAVSSGAASAASPSRELAIQRQAAASWAGANEFGDTQIQGAILTCEKRTVLTIVHHCRDVTLSSLKLFWHRLLQSSRGYAWQFQTVGSEPWPELHFAAHALHIASAHPWPARHLHINSLPSGHHHSNCMVHSARGISPTAKQVTSASAP